MKYGYFDEGSREYVITRPDTPTPWINYLGNGGYSAIISNTAGGMSFHRDPGFRRVTRYRFNGVPMDRPGKYIYLRDLDSGEYWSPSWQPVMRPLDSYECRHGMGVTKISGGRSGIHAETIYSIPLEKDHEIWLLRLRNESPAMRRLKVFAYVEFSWHEALRDTICDWPRKLFDARFADGCIIFDPLKEGEPLFAYFGASAAVDSYDCSRDAFLGAYRTESNPLAVEAGTCSNTSVVSDNACGGLCCEVPLAPGEEKTILFVLGVAESRAAAASRCHAVLSISAAERDLDAVRRSWETFTSRFRVSVPDADVELMLNTWNQYQCKTTFDWSRFVSFYERGVDRGIGFRDSMQDVLGVMHAVPGSARARIVELLAIQKRRGDAMSVFYPATKAAVGGGRSDDHLWSVLAVCSYIKETGDAGILEAVVPFHDGGDGTVLDTL